MTNEKPKKPRPKRVHQPTRPALNIKLPNDLVALCAREQIAPAELVRGFIADLCDIRAWTTTSHYAANGEAAHRAALAYHAVASQARNAKAKARAAGADVPTSQPAAETRAVTAVARDQRKDQP
jgi:hypothetical protein